ncbi:hypothetical protein ACNEAX_001691 [Escherichia coli]
MLQLLIGEIFLMDAVKCDEGFLKVELADAMKKVNDILTAFAKGVLYRESGVLNSHQS